MIINLDEAIARSIARAEALPVAVIPEGLYVVPYCSPSDRSEVTGSGEPISRLTGVAGRTEGCRKPH